MRGVQTPVFQTEIGVTKFSEPSKIVASSADINNEKLYIECLKERIESREEIVRNQQEIIHLLLDKQKTFQTNLYQPAPTSHTSYPLRRLWHKNSPLPRHHSRSPQLPWPRAIDVRNARER